jgi:hypothetical protein
MDTVAALSFRSSCQDTVLVWHRYIGTNENIARRIYAQYIYSMRAQLICQLCKACQSQWNERCGSFPYSQN